MEAASPSPTRRITVGEVLGETFSIYRDHFGPLIGSAIVVFAIVGLISGLLQSTDTVAGGLLAAIIRLAGYALYTGFVVRLVQDVRDGRRDETVGDLFSAAGPSIVALAAFGVLYGIGVTIGLVLFVVPGLILITFWSLGAPAIVVEDEGPIGAFGRSWRLVRGQAWSVFGVLLSILLIVIAAQLVLTLIAVPIGDAALVLAAILATAVTAPAFALAAAVMFFDLGGGGPATAAAPAGAAASPPTEPSG
jgi:hypothetical protein